MSKLIEERVVVTMTAELKAYVRGLAEADERSMNYIIRDILMKHKEQEEQNAKTVK